MSDKSIYHYVYRITNIIENKHYYGCRTCKNITPKEDLGKKYFSSSTDKNFISKQRIYPENFKYKVVCEAKTRIDALNVEIFLHNKFDVGINKNFYNKSKQTSTKFDTTGMTSLRDNEGNILYIPTNDPRYLSGELVGVSTGMTTLLSDDGSAFYVSTNDPRYLSGELVGVNSGKVTGKDKWKRPSLDHINPKAKGGDNSIDNLQFLIWFENRCKNDMSQEEWDLLKENIGEYLL